MFRQERKCDRKECEHVYSLYSYMQCVTVNQTLSRVSINSGVGDINRAAAHIDSLKSESVQTPKTCGPARAVKASGTRRVNLGLPLLSGYRSQPIFHRHSNAV